jgi:hypothetical protein
LGTELESLKMIFDLKIDEFYRTIIKETIAETEIVDLLHIYKTNTSNAELPPNIAFFKLDLTRKPKGPWGQFLTF